MSNIVRNHERKQKREMLAELTIEDLIKELKKRQLGDSKSHEDYELIFMPKGMWQGVVERKATEIAKETIKEARINKELGAKIDEAVERQEHNGIIKKCKGCDQGFSDKDTHTAIKVKGSDGAVGQVWHRDCYLKKGTETEKQETNNWGGEVEKDKEVE